jgi:biopolymer transport protein TolR
MEPNRRTSRTLAQINVTNLVDVMFVLLVIFMLVAPLMKHGIDVDLPQVSSKGVDLRDALVVTIDKDEKIYLNEQLVSLDLLEKSLQDIYAARPDITIFLKADKQVPYGSVVRIMGRVRRAGIEKLGMVTEPE